MRSVFLVGAAVALISVALAFVFVPPSSNPVVALGIMGASSSTPLTVASVLRMLAETSDSDSAAADITATVDALDDHDVKQRLREFGIDASEAEPSEARKCLAIVSQDRFWSRNAKLHPNFKRVKTWLWVHERYRDQLQGLVDDGSGSGFEAFAKKIHSHSVFEDTMLFRFFKENGDASVVEDFAKLEAQHADGSSADKVQKAIASGEGLVEALTQYRDGMLEHLAFEERTIVHRWLNLSPEAYAKYRSYLSWKYSFMY